MLTYFEVMLMSEKQRAYRYGMTLLCVGAFFNWLGLNEGNSDPLKFAGFTCLSSGALLVCVAICMWANSPRPRPSPAQEQNTAHTVVEIPVEGEKPPDYDIVIATSTPPPCYNDAIKLSPLYLTLSEFESAREGAVGGSASAEVQEGSSKETSEEAPSARGTPEMSRLGRMIKLSQRILRRTVSSPDEAVPRPQVHRSISTQEPKNT